MAKPRLSGANPNSPEAKPSPPRALVRLIDPTDIPQEPQEPQERWPARRLHNPCCWLLQVSVT